MRRALAGALAASWLLACLDAALARRAERSRGRESSFQPMGTAAGVMPAAVHGLEAALGMRSWRYARQDGRWHLLDRPSSFVDEEALGRALAPLERPGARVSPGRPDSDYGLAGAETLKLRYLDSAGRELLELWVGRDAPGPPGAAVYMKRFGEPGVVLVLADPRAPFSRALAEGAAPLEDRHVVPRSLAVADVAKIFFERRGYPLSALERSEAARPRDTAGRPETPAVEWSAVFVDGRREPLDAARTEAYARSLAGLRYGAQLTPAAEAARRFRPSQGVIAIADSKGRRDTIEVGGDPAQGAILVRCRSTGRIFSLPWETARGLFPTRQGLARPGAAPARPAPPRLPPEFDPLQLLPPGVLSDDR